MADIDIEAPGADGDDLKLAILALLAALPTGAAVTIQAGAGDVDSNGATIAISGGDGTGAGHGANATFKAGDGGADNAPGGVLFLKGGNSSSSQAGGNVHIVPGLSDSGASGNVRLFGNQVRFDNQGGVNFANTEVVLLGGLPTADPVNEGQLWNDSLTLKISAG